MSGHKKLTIALDYDGTFTADPEGWSEWLALFKARGHTVFIVTMRFDHVSEHIPKFTKRMVDGIYYTERKAKRKFMEEQGIKVDVWIDDRPEAIHMDAAEAFGVAFEQGNTQE